MKSQRTQKRLFAFDFLGRTEANVIPHTLTSRVSSASQRGACDPAPLHEVCDRLKCRYNTSTRIAPCRCKVHHEKTEALFAALVQRAHGYVDPREDHLAVLLTMHFLRETGNDLRYLQLGLAKLVRCDGAQGVQMNGSEIDRPAREVLALHLLVLASRHDAARS